MDLADQLLLVEEFDVIHGLLAELISLLVSDDEVRLFLCLVRVMQTKELDDLRVGEWHGLSLELSGLSLLHFWLGYDKVSL